MMDERESTLSILPYTDKGGKPYDKIGTFRQMKRTKRLIAIALMATVGFVFTAGDASAAMTAPGKVNLTSAKRNGTKVVLKWKKTRGATGYQVYRKTVGKDTRYRHIRNYSNKTFTAVNKGLAKGTTYRYAVRAYRTYKVKQYYNKKTHKWQYKKPKRKYIGKVRKVNYHKFGKFSNIRQVTVPIAAPASAKASWDRYSENDKAYWGLDLTWKPVSGAKKYVVYRDGKKVATVKVTYLYGQKVSGNVNHKLSVVAISASGKMSAKRTITAPKSPAYKNTTTSSTTKTTTTKATTKKTTTKATTKTPTKAKTSTVSYAFPTNKKITMTYNGTTFYLGQTWSASLLNNLRRGSSGYESVVRKNSVDRWVENSQGITVGEKTFTETVHMIDTKDYNQFLAVYVANNQIIRWQTNCSVMGKNGNVTLKRDASTLPAFGESDFNYKRSAVKIGGFGVTDCDGVQRTIERIDHRAFIENEKKIGFHFINAVRYVYGASPVKYHNILDGKTYTFNGKVTIPRTGYTVTYNNQRYGAQAWAETLYASNAMTHSNLPYGPCSTDNDRNATILYASVDSSYPAIEKFNENCGGGRIGEDFVKAHQNSNPHIAGMVDSENEYVGLGMWKGKECEQYGTTYPEYNIPGIKIERY